MGLGKSDAGVCGKENWDNCKESIRAAVSGKHQTFYFIIELSVSIYNFTTMQKKVLKYVKFVGGGETLL